MEVIVMETEMLKLKQKLEKYEKQNKELKWLIGRLNLNFLTLHEERVKIK